MRRTAVAHRRLAVVIGVLLLSVTGCGFALRAPAPTVEPLAGHRLAVSFSSEVADPYPVLSGPAQSYQLLRLNDRFRGALEQYARRKSAPEGGHRVRLAVHLRSASTSYEEVGASEGNGDSLLARTIHGHPLGPAELTKGVRLHFRLSLSEGERELPPLELQVDSSESIDRLHFDAWSYDYTGVFEEAVAEAVAAVDRAVSEGLHDPSSSQVFELPGPVLDGPAKGR
jgi:hypothetical protein